MPQRCRGGRSPRVGRIPCLRAFVGLGAAACLLGCATAGHHGRALPPLVAGRRAEPIPPAQLAPAARLARRFARAYVPAVYLSPPARLPGATEAVRRHLRAAAEHVPGSLRAHRPMVGAVVLERRSARAIDASVTVEDQGGPAFSVGFTLKRRAGSWRVVAISPPG